MAHNEHNRPKESGMVLIAIGILIFIFAPQYIKNDVVGASATVLIGFFLGGLGFYISFLKKRMN